MTANAASSCPKVEEHTPQPVGYLAWDEWAEKMSKDFRQTRCLGCGRLEVWVPKNPAKPARLVPPVELGCIAVRNKDFLI